MTHLTIESDGDEWTTTLADFLSDNDGHLSADDERALRGIQPGQTVTLGGGACPTMTVRRADA